MSRRPVCRTCAAKRHQAEPHVEGCDRVYLLTGGGAVCPCGACIEWTGDLDDEGQQWLSDWEAAHADCEDAA